MGFARCAQNCSQTASTSRLGTTMWVLHSGNEWSPFSKDAGQGHFEGPPQQPPRSRCVTRGIRVAVRVGRAGTAMWGRRPSRGGDCARARPRDRRGRDPRHQPTCGCGCGMVHRPFGRAGRATAVTHICLWSGAGGLPSPRACRAPIGPSLDQLSLPRCAVGAARLDSGCGPRRLGCPPSGCPRPPGSGASSVRGAPVHAVRRGRPSRLPVAVDTDGGDAGHRRR